MQFLHAESTCLLSDKKDLTERGGYDKRKREKEGERGERRMNSSCKCLSASDKASPPKARREKTNQQ